MPAFFRQLAKDVAVYGAGDMLLRGVSFISIPIYTRLLAPADFGVWSFVVATVGLISGVVALGIDVAYARYYFDAQNHDERVVVTSTALIFVAIWTAFVALLLIPLSTTVSQLSFGTTQYRLAIVLAFVAAPFALLNTLCGQALRNQFRSVPFAALNIVTVLLTVCFSIAGLVYLKLGIAGLFAGALAGSAVILPVRIWSIRSLLGFRFSRQLLRKLIAFGVPLVPATLAYWIFTSSDRLLLARMSTLTEVGLYSVAVGLTSVLAFGVGALGQAWSPRAFLLHETDRAAAPAIFGETLIMVVALFSFLAIGMTTLAPEILHVLTTPPYYAAATAVLPLAIGYVAYASTQVTAFGITLTKKTHYLAIYSWGAALINVSFNLLLIPRLGMVGASWATAFAYVFLTVAYFKTSQRLSPIVCRWRSLVLILSIGSAYLLAERFFPPFSLPLAIVLKIAFCLTYPTLLWLLGIIDFRSFRAHNIEVDVPVTLPPLPSEPV